MSKIQYTIRSIPSKLDQTLRARSKSVNKSLNEVVIETLSKGAGISSDSNFDDLDWFIGSKNLDSTFDEAQAWLEKFPKDIK